ncbi:MAG: hypothetical protein HY868_06440 [Chloroflexi bacterium]|nr:hypothetical protein [Chloroflexota bacterium]
MTRRQFLQLLTLASAGTLAGCLPESLTPILAPRKKSGVVLRLAGGDIGYPSPFAYVRGPGYVRMSWIFDTLIWKDSQGYIPWLATNWELSNDGKVWTLLLRPDIKWSDGHPLTAEDVAFTFDYIKPLPILSPLMRGIEYVESVRATSDRRVEIALSQPYAPFLANIAGATPIIPKHIWNQIKQPANFLPPEAVIGSGPYKLLSHNANGASTYVANENFWLGKPFVQRIELTPVADELQALRDGMLDGAAFPREGGITDAMLAPFEKPEFGILTALGEWNVTIHFNLTRGAPYDQTKFRQACAYAINRAQIVQEILFGRGEVGSPNGLAPSNLWYDKNCEPYAFNPTAANALLDELGYKDINGDSVRETPDGKPLALTLPFDAAQLTHVPEMIRAMLRTVGIAVGLKPLSRAEMDRLTSNGDYSVALIYYGGLAGDPDLMRQTYCGHSPSQAFSRVLGYRDARFCELADQQLIVTDNAKRRAMILEMQSILARDVPALPLYYPTRYWIYRKAVLDNWYYTPGGIASGPPFTLNKHAFVTGQTLGLQIRSW